MNFSTSTSKSWSYNLSLGIENGKWSLSSAADKRKLLSELPPSIHLDGCRLVDDNGTLVYLTAGLCRSNSAENSESGCAFFAGPIRLKSWKDPSDQPTSDSAELHSGMVLILSFKNCTNCCWFWTE